MDSAPNVLKRVLSTLLATARAPQSLKHSTERRKKEFALGRLPVPRKKMPDSSHARASSWMCLCSRATSTEAS